MTQWKRAGLITLRSLDRNQLLLSILFMCYCVKDLPTMPFQDMPFVLFPGMTLHSWQIFHTVAQTTTLFYTWYVGSESFDEVIQMCLYPLPMLFM
jgi:hypothetical protein